jgi:hypothetical protein
MNIFEEIKSGLKEINPNQKKLRNFGYLIGGIFFAAALFLFFKGRPVFWPWCLSGLFLLAGAIYPKCLLPFYFIWMGFSVIAGFFVSRIIFVLLFYLIITPTGFLRRLFKGDFIEQEIDKRKASYWVGRPPRETDPEKLF